MENYSKIHSTVKYYFPNHNIDFNKIPVENNGISSFKCFNDIEIIYYYVIRSGRSEKELKTNTKIEYLRELLLFYKSILKDTNMNSITLVLNKLTFQSVNDYLTYIMIGNPDFSMKTVYRKISIIKRFLLFLNSIDYVKYSFLDEIEYPEIQTQYNSDFLSFDEIKQLIRYFNHHPILNSLISVLVTTGIKLQELCELRVNDIEYIEDEYWLSFKKIRNTRWKTLLPPPVIESMITFRIRRRQSVKFNSNDSQYFFTTATGKKYGYKYLGNYLTRHLNKADLDFVKNRNIPITSSTFRLSYAVLCSQQNNDIVSLKDALGHKDVKLTSKFIHFNKESK
ncbi:tyrosine-type recombinase/integrase [Fictibacillus nanhaiensis]|uniref:tyrosine-type recombinase/integrase n=1 Tax=Fictibacillus nanhaiensis TaxID=742169 RepID=UPI001C959840|nr:tyrosine-type recombinase/integrase [Fictibacillus nanhaiensis]MBY6035771.1 tyrosine-type recombinase/integrase [Fictibacillus nanhaiensis]